MQNASKYQISENWVILKHFFGNNFNYSFVKSFLGGCRRSYDLFGPQLMVLADVSQLPSYEAQDSDLLPANAERKQAKWINLTCFFLFYVNCHSRKDWNDWCAKHPLCAIQSDFQPFCFRHMFTESDFHWFMPQGGSNANAEASSNSSNISWKSERHGIEPIRSLVWHLLFGILRELANSRLEQMEKPDLSR